MVRIPATFLNLRRQRMLRTREEDDAPGNA